MAVGLTQEQHGAVTIFTFTDSAEESVDAWASALMTLIEDTPPSERFYVLMDVSSRSVNFTRHARRWSAEIFAKYRTREGRIAFLFSSKTAPHFARLFFASLGKLHFDLRFFSDRSTAMTWLSSG